MLTDLVLSVPAEAPLPMKVDFETTKQAAPEVGLQWDLVLFGASCSGVVSEYYGDMGTTYSCGSIVANCNTFVINYNNANQFTMQTCASSGGCTTWTFEQYACYTNAQHEFVSGSSFQVDVYCNQ